MYTSIQKTCTFTKYIYLEKKKNHSNVNSPSSASHTRIYQFVECGPGVNVVIFVGSFVRVLVASMYIVQLLSYISHLLSKGEDYWP